MCLPTQVISSYGHHPSSSSHVIPATLALALSSAFGSITSGTIFSKIDLVLTRSGSSMLAELINAKIPFVSIPLPTSADDHQLKNAIYYEKNQYSYLIEEKDLSKNLFKLIKSIHKDRTQLDQIIKKQQEYSDKSVYENIDREITKIINEKN